MGMKYEAFLIHLEPPSLDKLAALIYEHILSGESAVELELWALANEIRARLQKVATGLVAQPAKAPEPDWLSI